MGMLKLSRQLNCFLDTINSVFDVSDEYFESFHTINMALSIIYFDDVVAERKITSILQHLSSEYSCYINPKHILELIELIVPNLLAASNGSSNNSTMEFMDQSRSLLKERIIWSTSSVIRANIRYLYDDCYPKISTNAPYSYKLTRSGLFDSLKIMAPQDPLLKKISGNSNFTRHEKGIQNLDVSKRLIDLCDVSLSTLIARALQQYDRVDDDFVHSFTEVFDTADFVRRTELSQIVVAAEGARIFLNIVLSLNSLKSDNHQEVWTTIEEMGEILKHHGLSHGSHWSKCADIDLLKTQLNTELNPKVMLQECCTHLLLLEQGGLQHPLALPVFDKKQRGRRSRSILSNIDDKEYADVFELVVNCDYIFDFPFLSQEQFS